MTGWKYILAAAVCWLMTVLPGSSAEQHLIRYGNLRAYVDNDFNCQKSAYVEVEAPDPGAYRGDRVDLQRLLGGIRATLGDGCPMLHDIDVSGYAGGELAYVANISADGGWRLPSDGPGRGMISPLAEAATACDYDRDQPFVGCWVQLAPTQFRGLILNVKRDGTWYWDRPEKLAAGTFEHVGKSITHDFMIGAGPFLTFIDQDAWRVNFIGPMFTETCNILKLGPYAPLGMAMFGPTDPQLLVRLTSPLKINPNILRSFDGRLSDGYSGNPEDAEIFESIPDDGTAFNVCEDNFNEDVEQNLLFNLIFTSIALERLPFVMPLQMLRQPRFAARLVKPLNPTDRLIGYFTAFDRGPLNASIVSTFRGGSYTAKIVDQETILYRSFGRDSSAVGSYWSRNLPQGPLQSVIDNALKQQNWAGRNDASRIAMARIPRGTHIFEGFAAPQGGLVGGGNQIYIENFDPKWIIGVR